MCRCIESIKLLDGKFFRPDRHQARIDQAFEVLWPGQKPFVLKAVLAGTGFPHKGLFKCRMVYDAQIRQIEFTPYVRRDVKSLKIMEIELESCRFKKENREELNRAFAQRGECDDVLLMRNGLLTDTSYSNIALFDGKMWHTPRTPLLYGTNRAELIESGKIIETDISQIDLPNFLQVCLFNAMVEFGELVLPIDKIYEPE